MIEIRPEELLTLCVRPRLGRMNDEDKRQRDQRDGRRIHLTEEEICLKNRDQLWVSTGAGHPLWSGDTSATPREKRGDPLLRRF